MTFLKRTLRTFATPVIYMEEEQLWEELDRIVKNGEDNFASLQTIPRDQLVFAAYRMLLLLTVSLKQPVFKEEREWRLVHLPFEDPSRHVTKQTEVIGGIPQIVYRIKFENKPADEIAGISLAELIDHIIIGPAQFPGPIYAALVEELSQAGVENAAAKVGFSNIPLRV
ncbi:MAG TPA: DUF2971 domain-containing protein [Stellaceae bacterium]|nr:DUF2971 domain-containing protein [Stellaceae bacterium]